MQRRATVTGHSEPRSCRGWTVVPPLSIARGAEEAEGLSAGGAGAARVVRFRSFGPPARVLEVDAEPWPAAGPGEVVVRMRARPVNPSDLLPVAGAYRHRTPLPGDVG